MTVLFGLLGLGAFFFTLPGGGRTKADRRLAMAIFYAAMAASFLTARLIPIGLVFLVLGGAHFWMGWLKQKLLHDGFQDLSEEEMGASSAPPPRGRAMSRQEALSILGLSEGADAQAIRAAHRRMIARAHPDSGGSDYLAAKVNAARETLLKN